MISTTNRLSRTEIHQLIKLISAETDIIGYSVADWSNFTNLQAVHIGQKLAAVILVLSINQDWQELAVLYVRPEFRNNGWGRKLFKLVTTESPRQHTLLITRNQIVSSMANKLGYQTTTFWALPWSVKWFLVSKNLHPFRIKEFLRKLFVFGKLGGWQYFIK